MKNILIIVITMLFKQMLFGQGGFSKNYFPAGSFVSICNDAIETPGGNIIMTGLTFHTPTGSNRLTIISADAQGNELWQKNYGSDKFEYFSNSFNTRSLIKGNNGSFYFYSNVRDSSNKYLSVLIKFNFSGDTLWQKKFYDGADYLYIQGITKSVDNGFLMTGYFEGTTNKTCLLIKTDSTGNELWRKKISKSAPNIQAGVTLIQDSITKNIVIAGYQANGSFSAYNFFSNIIVTDSVGLVLERKTYGGPCGSRFLDLIQTKDKKCVAVGQNDQCSNLGSPNGSNRYKAYIMKFDPNNLNNINWGQEFDVPSIYNNFSTINELKNGDLIMAGSLDTLSNHFLTDKEMLRLTKTDKDGNLKWNKLFSRDNIHENSRSVRGLNIMTDGAYLLATDLSKAIDPKRYYIVKIDSTGCDSTMAYCQLLGFNELRLNNTIFTIYPNPTNSILILQHDNFYFSENSEIKIIDIIGKQVMACKAENKINIKGLTNGIYFLQVFDNKKLIAIKKIIKE